MSLILEKKKSLLSQEGAITVDDLYSGFLYTGNLTPRNIDNGMDYISREGFFWAKARDVAGANGAPTIFDTVRGVGSALNPSNFTTATTQLGGVTAFNSGGVTIGNYNNLNRDTASYIAWSMMQEDGFFSIKVVSHTTGSETVVDLSSLGSIGMVIVKATASSMLGWKVWHTAYPSTSDNTTLSTSEVPTNVGAQFRISGTNLIILSSMDTSPFLIMAWAADGDFVKCGSYTGNGTSTGPIVGVGGVPKFVFIKAISAAGQANHLFYDSSRGADLSLVAGSASAEVNTEPLQFLSNGFQPIANRSSNNGIGLSYAYMAIFG
jgi:hypothetical protein